MVSPVPKHLRSEKEIAKIRGSLRDHVADITLNPGLASKVEGGGSHRAKYAPGLATELLKLARSKSVGDPMAGTGTLSRETEFAMALNDIDVGMKKFLDPLRASGCLVTYKPAHKIAWERDVMIFSPPYYPRTDRRLPNAHDDAKRGRVVGFRDSYNCENDEFIGNPGGVDAILTYREQMERVYSHLANRSEKMIVVTKNWMRLGVELRLDLDTILIARDAGWRCVSRHGFRVKPSLWARYNAERGEKMGRVGMIDIEDVLVFKRGR